MKKSIILMMAAGVLAFSACGSKTDKAGGADSAAVDSVATVSDADAAKTSPETQKTIAALTQELQKAVEAKDSKAVQATLANLQVIYKNLVEAGKLEEAKNYGSAIKSFVNAHADELKNVATGNTTISSLVNGIANLPTSAETTAEEAKKAVAADAVSLATPAIAKGATAVATAEAAAEAVKNAPATAKAAAEQVANEAVTSAQNKANEEVTKAQNKAAGEVTKAQNKANDAVNKAAGKALKGLGL